MAERNCVDVLGYQCRFVRCQCGRRYRWGYDHTVYGVFLNGVFIGTVQVLPGNGWNLVAQLLDGSCVVIRGSSRVKAVASYILSYILSGDSAL